MMSCEDKKPKSALLEVVENWRYQCESGRLEDDSIKKDDKDLETDAKVFFRYISKSTSIVTDNNVKLETRSSHEEALATVIQELGGVFTSTQHQNRVRGLYVLTGAIAGCSDAVLSNSVTMLLGKFLIGHCGPIKNEKDEGEQFGISVDDEDFETTIRDVAVSALGYLTQTMGESNPNERLVEGLAMRLQLSRQAIERRCAIASSDDGNQNEIYFNESNPAGNNIRHFNGGLSALTRSKRSICFNVIKSTISGVAAVTRQMNPLSESDISKAQIHLIEYATFVSNCLHGESDPRCLLQLLRIIHEMQLTFSPWFQSSKTPDNVFPSVDVFDAVSPYYPIQFTPPPNDVHGITRKDLHDALISVLNYTKMDQNAMANNRHSMLGLSIGLYLEQILPMQGDEKPSTVEKQEALDCLSVLLDPNQGENLCHLLDAPTIRNLAVALQATHAESSLAVASGTDSQREQSKRLADDCRTLVSRIAYHLEIAPDRQLFDAFVSEPLHKLSSKIKMSPSHSTTSIAYIACLAASGRSKTLRLSLSAGLEPLLKYLDDGFDGEEDVAAAVNGIGAFFSSCRVAIERAREKGVAIHPHPLEPYANKACKLLLNGFDKAQSVIVKIGIVRALESLIIASPVADFGAEDLHEVCRFLESLQEITVADTILKVDQETVEFKRACSSALGGIVGTALDSNTVDLAESTASPLLSESSVNNSIRNQIYPAIFDSASKNRENGSPDRLDRRALAVACALSQLTACSVLSSLLESLCSAIENDILDPSCLSSAEMLSYIITNGGEYCRQAYHGDVGSSKLLQVISLNCGKDNKPELRSSVANLALPTTEEEKKKLQLEIDVIFKLVENLLPAYEKFVPEIRIEESLRAVSNIMPPLSDEDTLGLCIRLPILETSLHGHIEADSTFNSSFEDAATAMLPGLADFVLSGDYDSRARAAAASCIHGVIGLVRGNSDCPAKQLLIETIVPAMLSAPDICSVKNCLQLFSLVGSAAAFRACSSAPTAAEIGRFFLELACQRKACPPFSTAREIDFSSRYDGAPEISLEMAAASEFGALLSGKLRPVVRQRLTYICLQQVKAEYNAERRQAISGQKVEAPQLGLLVIVCHIICCNDMTKMEKSALHQISSLVLEGLCSSDKLPSNAKILVLTSILKLISIVPSSVSKFHLTVVSGLLRAYAVSDTSSEVAAKLLALQALERMATIEGARTSAPTVRPAVVAILAIALNHPSGLLRQAAVDVQNAWHVVV